MVASAAGLPAASAAALAAKLCVRRPSRLAPASPRELPAASLSATCKEAFSVSAPTTSPGKVTVVGGTDWPSTWHGAVLDSLQYVQGQLEQLADEGRQQARARGRDSGGAQLLTSRGLAMSIPLCSGLKVVGDRPGLRSTWGPML